MRDLGRLGDLAVCEPYPPSATHGLLVFAVGVALALGRACDLPEQVSAELVAGAQFAGALRLGNRPKGRACRDRGAGGLGDALSCLLLGGWILSSLGVEAVLGGGGDCLQLGRERPVGA